MKIVLDCNVFISAGLINGVCRKVLFSVLEENENYVSEPILREYQNVISRKKFIQVKDNLLSLLEVVCELSELVESQGFNIELPDKDDVIYLDAAIAADAKYLITGNIKDFPERVYKNVRVISPAEFLNL